MPVCPPTPTEAVRLVPLQSLAVGGRWRTEAMRSYKMPVLLWFTRGQGKITVAGITRGYGAHNAVFIPARTMHGFAITSQVFGSAMFFGATEGLRLPDTPLHLRIRDGAAQTEMAALLDSLQRETDAARPKADQAVYHLTGLLAVWLDRQRPPQATDTPPKASEILMARFTEAVENQLYTGQSLSDFAEALGVTPSHLTRVCRETCGRPASEILADRVTFEARRLLADTSLPIKRVADILGFASAAYFSRAFHARTGVTPTAFRDASGPRPAAARGQSTTSALAGRDTPPQKVTGRNQFSSEASHGEGR